jgi:biopolymer transport protein ExbD
MPLKTQTDDQTSINLTPMIDIVFLLIIFFMVGTNFSEMQEQEKDIGLTIPKVTDANALTAAPSNRLIDIFADGKIELDRKAVSIQQLETELRAAREQYPKLGVVIRGDAEGRYQNVASVMATCRRAEISDLNIRVNETFVR